VEITVKAEKSRPDYLVETTYSFVGTSSSEGIEADLGGFGEISLRFTPSGEAQTKTFRHLAKGCTGPRKIVRQPGVFTGKFRFEGEAGYTRLEATEASGSVGTAAFFLCSTFGSGSPQKKHHARPPTYLDVATEHRKRVFSASLTGHGRRAGFAAFSRETIGAASIARWASVVGAPSMLHFAPDLSSATVAPPLPFSGTATFKRRPKGSPPFWSGSLAVSFLGEENVPLTGPSFTSTSLTTF